MTTVIMMMTSRRGGWNLNHTAPAYEEPVKEGLKQAMMQHEIVFKHQVQELHRLYWIQKNLMDEVSWKQNDIVSSRNVQKCQGPAEEKKAGDEQSWLPTANLMETRSTSLEVSTNNPRNFDLELPADEFIRDATEEITNPIMEVNNSCSNQCVLGTGHMKVDFSAGEAKVNRSHGFKAPADNARNRSRSRVTVLSDFCSVIQRSDDSENCSHTGHQIKRWHEQNFIHSDVGLKEHGVPLSTNSPSEEKQSKCKLMHIDLNIAQDEEAINFFSSTVETFPSPSSSSSVVLHGDNLRVSLKESTPSNWSTKESSVPIQPGVVSPGSENSKEKSVDSLLREPKYSCPSSVQASGRSSNFMENNWNYKESIVDNDICRSSIRRPEECCKNLVERFSASNGETQDGINESVLADLNRPGKENNESSVGQPHFSVNSVNRKNILISSSYMEHNCLHASAGSTHLPPNVAGGLEEIERHNEECEEDTISSHATAPDEKQQDELKESPIGINLNQLTGDRECTTKNQSVAEHAVISNSENSGTAQLDWVIPERICSKGLPNIKSADCDCVQDRPCNFDVSQLQEDMEQKLAQVVELDHIKAAETLLSISSRNPLYSLDQLSSNEQMEFECEQGNDHPQSSDSFETITLKLEELRDDGSSIYARQIDKESRKDACGIRLRRGRGLRDFQKDILPGIVSLSRHEICQDLYAINNELRKMKSCKTSEENWLVPVRSGRSRLYALCKRR